MVLHFFRYKAGMGSLFGMEQSYMMQAVKGKTGTLQKRFNL